PAGALPAPPGAARVVNTRRPVRSRVGSSSREIDAIGGARVRSRRAPPRAPARQVAESVPRSPRWGRFEVSAGRRTTAAERASCPTGAERRRTSRRGALATDSGAPRASSELEFDVDEADDATVAPSRHGAVPCATDLGDMRRRGALSSSGRHPALVVLGLGLVLLAGIGSG